MHEIKTKGSLFAWLKYALTILLGAGAVLLNTVPAFASSQNVGNIDRDTISISQFNGGLYPSQSAYQIEVGSTELYVPVYLNMSSFSTTYSETYLSGYVVYSTVGLNMFGSMSGAPTSLFPEAFEGVITDNMQVSFTTAYSLKIYFDNFRINDNDSSNRSLFLGYMRYTCAPASSTFAYQFPNAYVNVNATGGVVYGSAYEYGFVDSIIYAMNSADSMQDILDLLNDIDSNTGYLPEILLELQTRLPQLYSLIQQIWNTDTAILSVNQSTYNTVLSILAILQNAYAPQESRVEENVNEVEQGLGQLEMDLSVSMPSGVADLSDDYIAQIDTTYNTSVFNMLFNPTLVLMLCICFALAILSYMLYGGK